ncbi:MAG: 50S ribosomal protein L1 [Candidatus Dadabacteria bacterium]|nr:MAG: 50S ribosomal protein L1 [Candidatus Dadabacteria bacterium]
MKRGKRYKEALKKLKAFLEEKESEIKAAKKGGSKKKASSAERGVPLSEACRVIPEISTAKFDETVEIALRLGVDPRKPDQNVRGSVVLPHGLGKTLKVAVFAKGEKAQEAKEAGADIVGAEDLIEQVQGGKIDFDVVIATPDMMGQVGKLGKILGPRGLMPSPKMGTVTFDIKEAVRVAKAGRVEFKVDKSANLQAGVGKVSMGPEKIEENIKALIQAVLRAKPSTSKGVYLKTAAISPTMGPSVRLDVAELREMH